MPRARSLATLHREAEECTRCPLYARATQVVFGEGLTLSGARLR